MRIKRLIKEARATSFRKNMKRLLRRYWGNVLFHQPVIRQLRKEYGHVYAPYVSGSAILNQKHTSPSTPFTIWIMWWQGEEQMPDVIRICYQSVLRNANGCRVVLITAHNYHEYVQLPQHIEDKFKAKIIPIAQFSDFIRFSLLAKHGGVWLDAATFITQLDLRKLNVDFFTHRFKTKLQSTPTKGLWSIAIIAGKSDCILFQLLVDLLSEYWKRENKLIKYFLTDYFILLLYTDVPNIKKLIDGGPFLPSNFILKEFVNDAFDSVKWNEFSKKINFHTLSYKSEYKITTSGGNETYYGYLLKTMNKRNE